MDTSYSDACMRLQELLDRATNEVEDVLTAKEIADELRRYADTIERDI